MAKNTLIDNISPSSIYFVYTGDEAMKKTAKIFNLGNSYAFRFTKEIMNALQLKQNDEVEYEIKKDGILTIKKAQTSNVRKIIEDFYQMPFEEVLEKKDKLIRKEEEMSWGEDVGAEVISDGI